MSNENSTEPGVCKNASTDADEKGAWVCGASPDERKIIQYFEFLPTPSPDSAYAIINISKEDVEFLEKLLFEPPDDVILSMHAHFSEESDSQRQLSQCRGSSSPESRLSRSCSDESRKANMPPSKACSRVDARVEEPITHHFGSSQRQTGLAVGTSNQRYQMSVSAEQPASDNSHPSDGSFTDPPIPGHESRSSSGASPESDSNEDTTTPCPDDEVWLTFAYAKHRIMVALMRDVYAIFNSQWRVGSRNRAGSEPANTGVNSQDMNTLTPSSSQRGIKRIQDRKSHPPEDNDKKKRKTNPPKPGTHDQRRLFACCFHKYNAQKYCSNSDTGTKYRSCAGPGFSKISQLKQHLKRNHRAPIYCPRCWLVVESQAEMALHANAQERCERKEPQVQEGVNEDKMRMITETWGSSWEEIYEILFPGAPVPSPLPDYEADDLPLETLGPSSPQSQELQNFDVYNRMNLPLLVEESLRTIVDPQLAPIEERMRAIVVDIVRTCQSTVARNFQLAIAPASLGNRAQSSHQTIDSTANAGQTDAEPTQTLGNGTAGLEFFHEPPYVNAEASASLLGLMYDHSRFTGCQNQGSDSGYSSLPFFCSCSCHGFSNTWNTANGRVSCQSCAYMHIDSNDLNSSDLGNFNDEFDWNNEGNELGA